MLGVLCGAVMPAALVVDWGPSHDMKQAWTLREKLKADFERGGRAAEAMHLDIFGELLRGAETLAKGMDEANATIAEIQKLLADDAKEIPALRAMLVEARASSDAFAQASARSFGLMMESLAAIRVDLAANLALTEAVKEDTGEIREGVDDVSRKIDKQREEMQAGFEETQRIVLGRQGGSVPPPARQVRTNLSTAPNRNSVLTSREAIRAELLAWVTTPGHVRARAIVAAPGVNATDIALDVAHELVQSQAASAMPPRDVWWLTARRVEDDGPVFDPVGPLSRLLRQIGSERLPATEGEDPARVLAWSVKAALSEGPPALFVIDGITDAGLLDDLLPGGSCITLVTTNRTDLPRRLIPVPDSVPALTDDEAFELLTSRRPDLKDARNHPAMLKIIRDSSGIDIVLEQEENYLAKASRPTLDELAADLCGNAKDHPFIQDLPRGATSDARSVACAVNLSLGNLPADGPERSLLNHAAWCAPDAIPLSLLAEAAGLDLGEAEHAADELASRSIVRLARNEAGILISIHSPMQSVLRLQQISDGTLSAVDHLHGILIPLYSDVHNHTSYERRTELWTHCEAVSRIPLDLSLSEHAQLASVNLLAVLAGHLRLIGQLDAANANIEYCINWGRDHEAVPETDLAKWLELRGRIRQFTGDLVGAESDVNDALNYHMKQQEPNPAMVATLHAYRGRIRQLRGSLAEAESDVTYGMDLALSIPEHVRRDVEAWRGWRSHIRSMRGDLPGAIVDIEDCIQWFEVNQADNKRAMNTWLTIRAYVRYRSGDPVAAIKDIDAALAWFESLTPPYPQGEAETKAYRAAILHALGNNEAAYKDIQDAFVWADRSLYTNQWLIANWRHTRSLILSSRGDTTEAVEDITKSIDWCSRGGGSVWVMATLLKDSARILAADDRWALAIDRIEESVQLHESAFGIQHPWTAEVLALQEAIRAVALP